MMKKLALLVVMTVFATTALLSQPHAYVGSAKCAMCHKTDAQGKQLPIWQASKHSKSAAALTSPEAAVKAKEMKLEATSPECLKCHVPLAEKAPEIKAEGVTCEVCHGAGNDYRKLNVMKDRALAVKNGLVVYETPEAIKKQCLTCHENAHGLKFDFAASWEKIKHSKPKA
jgi:excinuclease UvrABC ATPase subunit